MKKLAYLLTVLLVLSFSFTSYAHEGISNELMKIDEGFTLLRNELIKLDEKYTLLRDENQRQRNEILKLYNLLSPEKAKKIPVLLYHHILKEEEIKANGWENNENVISVESFKEQMDYLHNNGYFTATLDELQGFIDGNIELPKKTVVITFDDGYLSNAIYAYPIMKEYGFKATIFMRGGASILPQKAFDSKTLQVISVSESYKYIYVFEYGCHTYNLHSTDKNNIPLLLSLPKDKIIEDLKMNKELFNTKYIAYPFGKYNSDTIEYIKELGYEMGFTGNHGYVSKAMDKLQLPRIIIEPKTTMAKFKEILTKATL